MSRRSGQSEVVPRRRMLIGYVTLLSIVAVIIAFALHAGARRTAPRAIAGTYHAEGTACLSGEIQLSQSGQFVDLDGSGHTGGKLRLTDSTLSGDVTCGDGGAARLDAQVEGQVERDKQGKLLEHPTISGSLSGTEFRATFIDESTAPATAGKKRSAENTFGRLMLAIAIVILVARLMGALVARIGQPRVMGEVIAGILLGPTLLGMVAPGLQDYLFPPDIVPLLSAGADIGLVFYMFLVGLELDPSMLRGRVEQAAFISHGSIAVPMALGIATAVPLYELVGPSSTFVPFALFVGVAMSITAFPVLARILVERRMLRRPVGAMAIGAAAVDDVTAWALLALATGVAETGGVGLGLGKVVFYSILFSAFMAIVGRRLLSRVAGAYDEAGHVPAGWIAAIFVGVLLSAYTAAQIPIAAIFGAFVMGLIMPRRADLTNDVSRRVEDFVVTVLLPLFFVTTGLRTEIGLLNRPVLWLVTLVLIAVAVFCKWTGAMGAARFTGIPFRESAAIGALMNTRGLTELIVLNIALDHGVVTPALFTMLVLMALVTTFMTGPTLKLIDPHGEMTAPVEEELREAEAPREPVVLRRSVIVAPQDERNADALLSLAEPLAKSIPPREVVLARLVTPSRITTFIAADARELARAANEVNRRRESLSARGVVARAAAFTSPDPGEDLVRLASEETVDLMLLDGRRPLLGEGVPRGSVGHVLEKAPCDVAVLVERDGSVPEIGPHRPVVVPFGGADHDWAALELGAWIASSNRAPLKLLGASGDAAGGTRDASRLLANASLVLQQLIGVAAEPVLVDPGRRGVLDAAEKAGLLVVGLSDRWRQEGLGPVRSAIARGARAPTLFVRRGLRPGALAPTTDVTRFKWSFTVAPSAQDSPRSTSPP